MMRFDGASVRELGGGFDLELVEAIRTAATPEEQVSANEAISVVTDTLRSNRVASRGTALRKRAASRGRRASARLGAAILVTVFTASASLAISGQLPSGARDVAAALLAQIGLFPGQRVEASGPLAAPQTTGEPFGPAEYARDVRFIWVPESQGEEGIASTPIDSPVDPPPVQGPPPVQDPPPVEDPPPPVVDPPVENPPPVEDPPVENPPPVEDPPVENQPPVEDPPVENPPPVEDPPVEDPPVENPPPPVEDPPPPVEDPPPPVEDPPPPVEDPPPPVDPPVENPPPVQAPPVGAPPVDPPVENPPPVQAPPVGAPPVTR